MSSRHRRIRRLLVANRGEIAARVMRTAGSMGIYTVAVYAEPDEAAPFVRQADLSIPLRGARADETYLNIPKLMEAASSSRADAIHPGYGFLAENPALAEACTEAGLIFVGPTAEAIALMGSKIEAKRVAASAEVPTLPSVVVDGTDSGIRTSAESIGYPLLIKPSAGGGGKGMHIAHDGDSLSNLLEVARREATSAFGDGALLLERYLASPRHIEVQVLGDQFGNVVHLFERECSIQRRHQKIIEEAPASSLDVHLRSRITDAAVRLAQAINYENAGTVEFLVDGAEFYFLEMNTRLQVEHPVTEEVTGLDLVRLQFHISNGLAIPFDQSEVRLTGHAIEARLYAEDPTSGFLPSGGTIQGYHHPFDGARYEDGVEEGSRVGTNFDPLLSKVITHGDTRHEAADRLVAALSRFEIHGLETNRTLLLRILDDDAFRSGHTTTDLLDRRPDLIEQPQDEDLIRFHAVAAALVTQHRRRRQALVLGFLPSGWRNVPDGRESFEVTSQIGDLTVEYTMTNQSCDVAVNGVGSSARIHAIDDHRIDLEHEGVRRECTIHLFGDQYIVTCSDGQSIFTYSPRFRDASDDKALAGGPTAPMPGLVIVVAVAEGDEVAPGDTLVVLEAMKMEHRVQASVHAKVTRVLVEVGQSVEAHQVLAQLEEAE